MRDLTITKKNAGRKNMSGLRNFTAKMSNYDFFNSKESMKEIIQTNTRIKIFLAQADTESAQRTHIYRSIQF